MKFKSVDGSSDALRDQLLREWLKDCESATSDRDSEAAVRNFRQLCEIVAKNGGTKLTANLPTGKQTTLEALGIYRLVWSCACDSPPIPEPFFCFGFHPGHAHHSNHLLIADQQVVRMSRKSGPFVEGPEELSSSSCVLESPGGCFEGGKYVILVFRLPELFDFFSKPQ